MADGRARATPNPDHAGHDPELIAALLDADLPDADRTLGTARLETCPECARLHEDLLALVTSTRAIPAAARTRDFRLSAAAADRLTGEPLAATTRPSDEMTDPRTASAHASHDTLLVASLADHSLPSGDRVAAERLIAVCGLCAALHDDLLAIRTATIQLPTPLRTHDYQLTEVDAARLRRSGWRRWAAAFGSSRDTLTRPLAAGLTTLGIIGILVANAPVLSFGGAATSGSAESAPASASAGGAVAAMPAASARASDGSSQVEIAGDGATTGPVAPALPSAAVPALPAATSPEFLADQGRTVDAAAGGAKASTGTGRTDQVAPGVGQGRAPIDAPSSVSPLIVLSGILLVAGLGLFLLRWMARRLRT